MWVRLATRLKPASHLDRAPGQLALFVAFGAALAVGGSVGVAWAAGFGKVETRLLQAQPYWIPLALLAEAIAYLGYVLAYRELARVGGGAELELAQVVALVTTGFGVFIARGGFAVDQQAFRDAGVSRRDARVRVLGLGALEYVVLAPAACLASIILLVRGASRPSASFTLPWAIAVPVGAALAAGLLSQSHRFDRRTGWRSWLAPTLEPVEVVRKLIAQPLRHGLGLFGMGLYWFGEVFCLWATLRVFLVRPPSISALVVGFATGYALTRRSLPLAGAGAVEALLPFALAWSGMPLAAAVLAVFCYRFFNLWLPVGPALAGLAALKNRRVSPAAGRSG